MVCVHKQLPCDELQSLSVFMKLLWFHCQILHLWGRSYLTFPTQHFSHWCLSVFLVLQDCCHWKRTWCFQLLGLCFLLLKLCVELEEGFMPWNVLHVGYWTFHSDVTCLEVASLSKLGPNNLVENNSYVKWGGDENPDFCEEYTATRLLGTEMKIGSDSSSIWISDMGEAGWDIYVILLVWWRVRRILWAKMVGFLFSSVFFFPLFS